MVYIRNVINNDKCYQQNKNDKKALADAGMTVGKVNAALKSHFEKVGQTMSKEWASKAGSRGQTVLSKY